MGRVLAWYDKERGVGEELRDHVRAMLELWDGGLRDAYLRPLARAFSSSPSNSSSCPRLPVTVTTSQP